MPPIYSYLTLAEPTRGEYKDRGSRFLALAVPVNDQRAIATSLEERRREHGKASHHAFAWRLGIGLDLYRTNDDGEPSGTAGKPILGQIDKWQLTQILVVVTRYFGGSLLGTSGLTEAYRAATAQALASGILVHKELQDLCLFDIPYAHFPRFEEAAHRYGLHIDQVAYDTLCHAAVFLPRRFQADLFSRFMADILTCREDTVIEAAAAAGLHWRKETPHP